MEEKGELKSELARTVTNIANNITPDLQLLAKIVRPQSKTATDVNTNLINELVLATPRDILPITNKIFNHLIQIIDFKGTSALILSIISKSISLLKMIFFEQKYQRLLQYPGILADIEHVSKEIVDVVFLLSNKHKDVTMQLRIVQTAYTIVQPALLSTADYHFITRLYSIFFKCCLDNVPIQNISASAIFTLTDIVFTHNPPKINEKLLTQLLQFTVVLKKCQWIKDNTLRSITWDIICRAVKIIPTLQWQQLSQNELIAKGLVQMYRLSLQNSFPANPQLLPHDVFLGCIRLDGEKVQGKRNLMWDYIKCYKVFIYFSIYLSLELREEDQLVPFRKKFNVFQVLYDYQRTTRFYVILQGICLLLQHGSILVLEEDRGIILIDIFQKVCEDLYSTKVPFQITWEGTFLRIEKLFDDYSKITEEGYLKLTKNSLIFLRKGLEAFQSSPSKHVIDDTLNGVSSHSEQFQLAQTKQNSLAFRWRRLIKSVIRIVRYLTSLKFKKGSNDQAIRKFIMELQYWFIICPTHKTRNAILAELQQNTNNIENINQAIKASQCMQICSNIIFGFYSILNSVGVATIVRILANIKINYESGKDFNQLDEVCQMADKFYVEQKIIESQDDFKVTIEGFIQCINLIIADLHIPSEKGKDNKQLVDKYLKIIEYVLVKLKFVIEQNIQFLPHFWNFIECFWISLASNKQTVIRHKINQHIQQVFVVLLKGAMINEKDVMHFYAQLSKFQVLDISKMILDQTKTSLFYIRDEDSIVSILLIMREIKAKKYQKQIISDICQIEEFIVKESIFKVKSQHSLKQIIGSLSLEGKDNNQEYQTVSLFWNISDHLKQLHQQNKEISQAQIWRIFFAKINQFTKMTPHPGTRQSCIHTFTQTIATCRGPIGQELFVQLLTTQYLFIYCLLMGFNQEAVKLDPMVQVDMEKVAIKNISKLTKSCISSNYRGIDLLLRKAVENLTVFIAHEGNGLPIQYYIELCQLFDFLKELIQQEKEIQKQTKKQEYPLRQGIKVEEQKRGHKSQNEAQKVLKQKLNGPEQNKQEEVQQWDQQEFNEEQKTKIEKQSTQEEKKRAGAKEQETQENIDQSIGKPEQQIDTIHQEIKQDKKNQNLEQKQTEQYIQGTNNQASEQKVQPKQIQLDKKSEQQEVKQSQQQKRTVDVLIIKQALTVIQNQHQYLDHKIYYWRKYQQLFNAVKQYFNQE